MASIAKLKGWSVGPRPSRRPLPRPPQGEGIERRLLSPRHCERIEAIHLSAPSNGLLRYARNDGGHSSRARDRFDRGLYPRWLPLGYPGLPTSGNKSPQEVPCDCVKFVGHRRATSPHLVQRHPGALQTQSRHSRGASMFAIADCGMNSWVGSPAFALLPVSTQSTSSRFLDAGGGGNGSNSKEIGRNDIANRAIGTSKRDGCLSPGHRRPASYLHSAGRRISRPAFVGPRRIYRG